MKWPLKPQPDTENEGSKMTAAYLALAERIADRIVELIPAHPEIMRMRDAHALKLIAEFKYDDIEISFYQLSWALNAAQRKYRMKLGIE